MDDRFDRGVGGVGIKGIVGFRFTAIKRAFILSLVVEFVPRVVTVWFSDRRECPRSAGRAAVNGRGRGSGRWSWC